uniref:PiggyBac transposable element-derived protein domain-containing protein n=1 Tax=Glossina pallidipes TaxID=7398 RepID=A0A1B0A8N8_GLOPL
MHRGVYITCNKRTGTYFKMSKRLKDKDVEDLLAGLENGDISEDEEGVDDLNEFDYYPDVQDLMKQFEDNNDDEEEQDNENLPLPLLGVTAWSQRSGELIWKKRNPQYSEESINFTGNTDLPLRLAALETPFQFFAEFIMINTWVLYKKNNPPLTLGDYRSELAETLCSYKKYDENKRARSSDLEREIEAKKHRGPTKPIPPKDIRTDGIGHDEKRCSSKNRCKLPGCKGFSRTECIKCKVTLCHNKNRNCFAIFHS